MKKVVPILILTPALLIGCGMSDTERQNLASVTCSIVSETRNMDAAIRVEKINDARTALRADPYLDGDNGIKESLEWGMCEELVLDDPDYTTKLEELMLAKVAEENADEIAQQKRIEDLETEYALTCPESRTLDDYESFSNQVMAAMGEIADGKKLPLEDEEDLQKIYDLQFILQQCGESRTWTES